MPREQSQGDAYIRLHTFSPFIVRSTVHRNLLNKQSRRYFT